MKRSTRKLPPDRVRELEAIGRKIDREEADAIRSRGRRVFERHARLRSILLLLQLERERQGLSLTEVAEKAGIDKANLHRLESQPDANPTMETILRYAEALGSDVMVSIQRRQSA